MDTQKLDQAYIANTYARFPVTIVKGKGSLVWDDTGKEYIDLSTGIAVDIFGVADEEWVAAVTKQLGTLQHISNLYYTEPCAKLAQMLCEKTGMKKVFFGNSGAEANECAIKAARKWSEEKKGKEYATIITLKNSFHGRTITTLAATGQDVFHHDFTPLTEGFVYAEPNDLADLEQLIKTNKCAAVMMEVVQGEGGVMPLDEAYVKGAAKLCEEYDLLLICDEVQVGNGRSGKLYGYMHYGIQPDIVSTAKGLAGGRRDAAGGKGAECTHCRNTRLDLRRKPCLLRGRDQRPEPFGREYACGRRRTLCVYQAGTDRREGRARRIRSRPDDRHPDREKRIRYHCSLPRKGCSGHQGQGQAALAAGPQYPDGAAEKSSRCHKSVLRVSVDAHRETFNSMTLRCHAVLLRLAIPAAFPAHLCMNGLWLCRGEIQ